MKNIDLNNTFYIRIPEYNPKSEDEYIEEFINAIRESIDKSADKQTDVTAKKEKQSDLEYYASKEFNLFEVVHFLKENPDWIAETNNKQYGYENHLYEHPEEPNEWLPRVPVKITNELLNMTFKLIPPQPKEEWVDCMATEAIEMLLTKKTNEVKAIQDNGGYVCYDRESMGDATLMKTYKCKWQYLKKEGV